MRLKPAGIIIVLIIIGVLAYFAIKPKLSKIREENSTTIMILQLIIILASMQNNLSTTLISR